MSRSKTRTPSASGELESFLDALRYFLTAHLWKQVLAAFRPGKASRWQAQPLVFVLLVLTWCSGDSSPERFETARAFYVALHQKRRRPGATCEGFQKALARVPMTALRLVAAAVRCRLAQVFAARFRIDGFVPIGCDGSRVACPRSAELEQRLGGGCKDDSPPMLWVTALVHRELEGSLLAVQLLLGQGAMALQQAGEKRLLPSPLKILLEIRAAIRNVVGMYLGPRQRQTYWQRLQRARGDSRRRRTNKVRRPWPAREPHRPPGAPKILKMGGDLKHLMEKTLDVA